MSRYVKPFKPPDNWGSGFSGWPETGFSGWSATQKTYRRLPNGQVIVKVNGSWYYESDKNLQHELPYEFVNQLLHCSPENRGDFDTQRQLYSLLNTNKSNEEEERCENKQTKRTRVFSRKSLSSRWLWLFLLLCSFAALVGSLAQRIP